ncbi:MAG: HNH endonuclease [Acidithiobacillus sp.]
MGTAIVKCTFCDKNIIRKVAPSIKTKSYFCCIQCKSLWQKLKKPVTREWLFDKYINEGLDCTQIAHMVNRDPKSVWNWLKDFEIPTRARGTTGNAPLFKKGESSKFSGHHHTEETKKLLSKIAIEQGRVPFNPEIGSYMKGRKGDQTPNWKGGVTPERQSFYSSREWVDAVKNVWERDEAICQRCGKHHNETKNRGTFHIHHIVSFMVSELRSEVSNLVLLCDECHRFVHSNKNLNKVFLRENP